MPHQEWKDAKTGEIWPSVTEVVGLYVPDGLVKWRGFVGNERADAVVTEAGRFGTLTHAMIEERLDRGERLGADFATEPEAALADKAVDWLETEGGKVVARELGLSCDLFRYGGTCDLICTFRDDPALVVVDWKTSSSIKDIYRLQLAAYAHLYNRHKKRNWMLDGINSGCIVRLDKKDGNRPPEIRKFENLALDFEAFVGLRTMWDFLHGTGKWSDTAGRKKRGGKK